MLQVPPSLVSFPGAAVLLKRIGIAREIARGRVGCIHFITIQRIRAGRARARRD